MFVGRCCHSYTVLCQAMEKAIVSPYGGTAAALLNTYFFVIDRSLSADFMYFDCLCTKSCITFPDCAVPTDEVGRRQLQTIWIWFNVALSNMERFEAWKYVGLLRALPIWLELLYRLNWLKKKKGRSLQQPPILLFAK